MKTLYGLQVRHNGSVVLNTTDRTGRIVGYHEIPLRWNSRFQKTFSHPELAGMGEMFYWFSHTGFFQIEAKGAITIRGTDIVVDVTVSKGCSGVPVVGAGKLYYGVR